MKSPSPYPSRQATGIQTIMLRHGPRNISTELTKHQQPSNFRDSQRVYRVLHCRANNVHVSPPPLPPASRPPISTNLLLLSERPGEKSMSRFTCSDYMAFQPLLNTLSSWDATCIYILNMCLSIQETACTDNNTHTKKQRLMVVGTL